MVRAAFSGWSAGRGCGFFSQSMTTVYLVRHAQAHPQPDQPEPDWPLSAVGEAQARGLAPILRRLGVGRIYSSPYRRCRDTLAPFAAAGLGCPLHAGLRERRVAPPGHRDFREVWRRSWEDFSYALPGGEDSWTCRARIAAAVAEIADAHPGETLALASHGNAIGLFLHSVDATFGLADASGLRTPEIVRVVQRDAPFCVGLPLPRGLGFRPAGHRLPPDAQRRRLRAGAQPRRRRCG